MNRGNLPLIQGNDTLETEPDQSLLTRRYTEFCTGYIKRKAAGPFFLYLAHTMPHIPIYASEGFLGKSAGGLYGDVIEEIDWSVGEIVRALGEEGILEHTLLIFTSDNGPWLSFGNHGGSSGPLRGGKFDVFEGGFRVPCIMSWPGVIPEGISSNAPVSAIDILPTICKIAGAPLPNNKFDGQNILPILKGDDLESINERFYYYFAGKDLLAVRKGKWKYCRELKFGVITEAGLDGKNGKTESRKQARALYNLDTDVNEQINLIIKHPEIAEKLEKAANTFESLIREEARPVGVDETHLPENPK
jgi:arylsulfatase